MGDEEQQALDQWYQAAYRDILLSSVCNRYETRTKKQQLDDLEKAYKLQLSETGRA